MASLDYLRLAAFEFNYACLIAEFMSRWPGEFKQARWLNYKGWRNDTLFVGIGEQNTKKHQAKKVQHVVVSASGATANDLARWMENSANFYCTRLDVQRTIAKPKYSSLRRICKATGTDNTTLIESKENDTLYVGSRTSDCYTRLYEKVLDDVWLRLEFELKGARSRAAWGAMIHGKEPAHIFSHYLDKSKLPNVVKSWFSESGDDLSFKADREIVLHGHAMKLKWLRSLDASMEKYMNNHQIGEAVRELVRSWSAYADMVDKT